MPDVKCQTKSMSSSNQTYLEFHLKLNLTFDMVINSFRRLEKNGAVGADIRGKI